MPNLTPNYNLKKPIKATENADIDVINSNMDKIDTQMKYNADNITILQNKKNIIIKKNIVILTSNWESFNVGEFKYRYYIKNLGVTFDDMADVNIRLVNLSNATGIASSCETTTLFGGSVILYATEKPIINIEADIRITKEVV